MKKLFIILAIILITGPCLALDWVLPYQATIVWDVLSGENVTYNIYTAKYQDYESKNLIGSTTETRYVVTIPTDTGNLRYVVGVSAVVDALESDINWSDVNGVSTPNPFAFVIITPPQNLRRE